MDFRIGAKLGRGPLGASYAGQLPDGRAIVVKAITSRFQEHPQLLEQVLGDLRAWVAYRHANVAATLAVTQFEGRWVILAEQAPGKTLERWVKEHGPFDPRTAVKIIRDVALALVAAHKQGLAAGDLRAPKVYYDGQRAVLVDLGQARGSCLAAGFGAAGMHFGHPDAIAPEVFVEQLERPTPAGDVYAMGMLLYELLVGAPPYRGEVQAVLRQHFDAPLPPVPVVQASPALARFFARLTAKEVEQRFADAQAVVEGLFELLGRPAPAPTPTPAPAALTSTIWRDVAEKVGATSSPSSWGPTPVEAPKPVGPSLAPPDPERTTSIIPKALTTTVADVAAAQGAEGDEKKPAAIKLGRKLGNGPVGSTYQGELKDHAQPVAVKVLSQRFSKYPDLLKRIVDSAKKAEGMLDPHVVGLLRVLHVAGRDTFVMELAPGRTLREVLKAKKRLPAAAALALVKDLAMALQQGRGRELSHGDVRPEKVFVQDGSPARLADFGLAEAAGLGANFGQFGVPWGHPDYLAPEVIQDPKKLPAFQTDCYSLGILTYEVLTGKPPFQGTPQEVLKAHLQAPIPPPPKEAGVPAPLAELILRLAAKDPKRRPDAPLELLQAIERCRKQVELASQAIASPPVEEFDPTATGEKGEGWMPVDVPTKPAATKAHKKIVKTTKALQVPPVAPELGEDMLQSEELRRPDL